MSHSTTHNNPAVVADQGDVDEPDGPWLTTEEAAEMSGAHVETMRRWIREGAVTARLRGRRYEVLESSVLDKAGRGKRLQGQRAPEGGGIYDPRWGPFTRDPFHSD